MPEEVVKAYRAGHAFSSRVRGDHDVLSFLSETEEPEWEEDGGDLSALIPLRADLRSNDYRCLYLGWLRGVEQSEVDDDAPEPPVPAGLSAATGSRRS